MIYNFLFPRYCSVSYRVSMLLLSARFVFGIMFMTHGLDKLINFESMLVTFPDPIGLGAEFSLIMAISAELFCSVAFIFGFLYRLAMLPMMFTMLVAIFVVHQADPFAVKELAFVYLFVFIFLYITGPGKYSVDYLFARFLTPSVQMKEA